jgi:hypothetical protein
MKKILPKKKIRAILKTLPLPKESSKKSSTLAGIKEEITSKLRSQRKPFKKILSKETKKVLNLIMAFQDQLQPQPWHTPKFLSVKVSPPVMVTTWAV